MKRNAMGLVAVLGAVAVVSGAWAVCPEKCGKSGKAKAVTVSDDGRSETTKTTPCSKSKATTVADKAPCGSSAKTVSTKAPWGSRAALTSSKGGCKVTEKVNAILASMPGMKFKIGSETTSCCQSAAALAKKHNKPIEYVVGEDTFKTEGEATARLASLIEKQVEEMKTVQFAAGKKCYHCPKTAAAEAKKAGAKLTYRIGGVDFEDKTLAHRAALLAKEKLGEIKMSYRVGESTFCCDKMAGASAQQTGKKMIFVIGEEETDSENEARMLMAKAKLAAIIAAATAILAS